MWVLIREASAAKNFEALWPLVRSHPDREMLGSDDKHPDGLVDGHIHTLCARAVALDVDVFDVLRATCLDPRDHYTLPIGRPRVGDAADMVLLEDLVDFKVHNTWIEGWSVAANGDTLRDRVPEESPNRFHCTIVRPEDLGVPSTGAERLVVGAFDGQLITTRSHLPEHVEKSFSQPDLPHNVLKPVVVDRYTDRYKAVACVHGLGLEA